MVKGYPFEAEKSRPFEVSIDRPCEMSIDHPYEVSIDHLFEVLIDRLYEVSIGHLYEESIDRPYEVWIDRPYEVWTDRPSEGSTDHRFEVENGLRFVATKDLRRRVCGRVLVRATDRLLSNVDEEDTSHRRTIDRCGTNCRGPVHPKEIDHGPPSWNVIDTTVGHLRRWPTFVAERGRRCRPDTGKLTILYKCTYSISFVFQLHL